MCLAGNKVRTSSPPPCSQHSAQDPPYLGDLPMKEETQSCLLTQKFNQATPHQPHGPGFLEKPQLAEPTGSGVGRGLPTKAFLTGWPLPLQGQGCTPARPGCSSHTSLGSSHSFLF